MLMRNMGKYLLWVNSWLSIVVVSNALYFYLEEGEEKCFLQELSEETLVIGNYRCSAANVEALEDTSREADHGMTVEIEDPQKRTVFSRPYRKSGRFSFKSHVPGVHTICLHSTSEHVSKHKLRIDFDLQVGEHAINRTANRYKLNLTNIEEKYQELLGKAEEVNKETDYLRYREAMFRETTETISRRVLLWMIGETALLIIIALWQVENLKKFFESKKMV